MTVILIGGTVVGRVSMRATVVFLLPYYYNPYCAKSKRVENDKSQDPDYASSGITCVLVFHCKFINY